MLVSSLQNASNTAITTSVTASLGAIPTKGNLLVACVIANVTAGSVTISGFTSAVNVALALNIWSNQIFFKICDGTDTTSIQATGTLATVMQIHAFEFTGFDTTTGAVLDKTASSSDLGSAVTSRASGTTATLTNPYELAIASIGMSSTNGGGLSWNNSFNTGLTTTDLATAYFVAGANTALNTTASWTTLALSAGCVATFNAGIGNSYWRGGGR